LVRRARSWAAYARGQRSVATTLMMTAAEWSRAHGQRHAELRALHDAVRLQPDRRVAATLVEVGSTVEGPLARALEAHAAALVDDDGAALEAVATQFEETGAMLLAAEAAAQSGAAFARSGLTSRSARAGAHARAAAECCEGARSPVLEQLDQPAPLTMRENEVARLAANGLTAREIAGRLFISTRTAEGHLLRAYSKLGVRDRQGLSRLLQAASREAAKRSG
jgi:DNA-binding CsgD family transcriptional regulator